MFSDSQNTINLSPLLLREASQAMQAFSDAEDDVRKTLKSFPIADLIQMRIEMVKQIEWVQRPSVFIEPMPFVEPTIAVSNTIATLCLDTKHFELYEYDNYRHRKVFNKKAEQQFKILKAICRAEGSYVSTAKLIKIGGYKTIGATYKAVEKINFKASSIGLPDKIIIGSQGNGYHLNPDYRVSIV